MVGFYYMSIDTNMHVHGASVSREGFTKKSRRKLSPRDHVLTSRPSTIFHNSSPRHTPEVRQPLTSRNAPIAYQSRSLNAHKYSETVNELPRGPTTPAQSSIHGKGPGEDNTPSAFSGMRRWRRRRRRKRRRKRMRKRSYGKASNTEQPGSAEQGKKAEEASTIAKPRRVEQQDRVENVRVLRKSRKKKRWKKHKTYKEPTTTAYKDPIATAVVSKRNPTFFEKNYNYDYPVPLNAGMEDLQVNGALGKLKRKAIKRYYRRLVKRYLYPFRRGISRDMYFDILRRKSYDLTPPGGNKGGQTFLVQIVDRKVHILDPYRLSKGTKPFYRSRIREVVWLLRRVLKKRKAPNTEFLLSIHDCIQTVNTKHHYRGATYVESRPIFSIVRCSFSDNIPFPMWEGGDLRGGGFDGWDRKMKGFRAQDSVPWKSKIPKAVFRGGNRPSMYFAKKADADMSCNEVGRTRLAYIAKRNPHLYDVSVGGKCGGRLSIMDRMEAVDQQKFKYILYTEGNCFWADRINMQVFGPSAVIKQETPCGQFWEPLLQPMVHFVPTDFFLRNTTNQLVWAQNHDEDVRNIVANANEFASNFVSLRGIESYVEVLLEQYTKLLNHKDEIKLEVGAEEPRGRYP